MSEILGPLQERAEAIQKDRIEQRRIAAEAAAQAQAAERERWQTAQEEIERAEIVAELVAEAAVAQGIEPDTDIEFLGEITSRGWKIYTDAVERKKHVKKHFGLSTHTEKQVLTSGEVLTTDGQIFYFYHANGAPEQLTELSYGPLPSKENPYYGSYGMRYEYIRFTLANVAEFAESHGLQTA